MKFLRRFVSVLMSIALASACFINGMAANEYYEFKLRNTDTSYNVYTGSSNLKSYAADSATVNATYNIAPGWGFAFCLKHSTSAGYITDTVTSPGQWLSGTGTIHPPYLSGHNVVNRYYYIAARIDNDYTGEYGVRGVFNSDYTNP